MKKISILKAHCIPMGFYDLLETVEETKAVDPDDNTEETQMYLDQKDIVGFVYVAGFDELVQVDISTDKFLTLTENGKDN